MVIGAPSWCRRCLPRPAPHGKAPDPRCGEGAPKLEDTGFLDYGFQKV